MQPTGHCCGAVIQTRLGVTSVDGLLVGKQHDVQSVSPPTLPRNEEVGEPLHTQPPIPLGPVSKQDLNGKWVSQGAFQGVSFFQQPACRVCHLKKIGGHCSFTLLAFISQQQCSSGCCNLSRARQDLDFNDTESPAASQSANISISWVPFCADFLYLYQ